MKPDGNPVIYSNKFMIYRLFSWAVKLTEDSNEWNTSVQIKTNSPVFYSDNGKKKTWSNIFLASYG